MSPGVAERIWAGLSQQRAHRVVVLLDRPPVERTGARDHQPVSIVLTPLTAIAGLELSTLLAGSGAALALVVGVVAWRDQDPTPDPRLGALVSLGLFVAAAAMVFWIV